MKDANKLVRMKATAGLTEIKALSDNRWAGVHRFGFTDAILTGDLDNLNTYADRWCYERGSATAALKAWNGTGEPAGWHRHPRSGRRRPEGDAAREYFAP